MLQLNDTLPATNQFAETSLEKPKPNAGKLPERKISKIEFLPYIFPKYIEVGKPYAVKKETVESIKESELMVHIYTKSCGIDYGSPISIYKRDVVSVTYINDTEAIVSLFI
jgi:hypothetical protein